MIDGWSISCEINLLIWMSLDFTDDQSILVQYWLGAIGQQAITRANVDTDLCRPVAALGHNELMILILICQLNDIIQDGWQDLAKYPGTPSVNSLWPGNATWRHGSGSTLAQVITCCLMATSHYLNQCWSSGRSSHIRISEGSFAQYASAITLSHTKSRLKITYLKFHPSLRGVNELNDLEYLFTY